MAERAKLVRLSNQRMQAPRLAGRPKSNLFHEGWERRWCPKRPRDHQLGRL